MSGVLKFDKSEELHRRIYGIDQVSELINAYNRLLARSKALNEEPPPSYHDMLERGGVMKMKSADNRS